MITQLYASLATGFFLLLTVRIFGIRGNPLFKFISYGNENEEVIHRAVRGHGNFIEYAPLFFILLYLAEEAGTHNHILHSLAIMFMIGRVMHGILFSFMLRKSIVLRGGGMFLTLLALGLVGLVNFVQYIAIYF
tara:strand:+ start:12 stop:413 length:402 start_codon:yes stop_codon:yes gene_type:complete